MLTPRPRVENVGNESGHFLQSYSIYDLWLFAQIAPETALLFMFCFVFGRLVWAWSTHGHTGPGPGPKDRASPKGPGPGPCSQGRGTPPSSYATPSAAALGPSAMFGSISRYLYITLCYFPELISYVFDKFCAHVCRQFETVTNKYTFCQAR